MSAAFMSGRAVNAAACPAMDSDGYAGSIYGSAALGYMTLIHTLEALDTLEERCPELMKHGLKRSFNAIMREGGEADRLRHSINMQLRHERGRAWMADFGNAAYGAARPHLERLQFAVANYLGRHRDMPSPNALAGVVVAQSLAREAAVYTARRASLAHGFSVSTRDRRRVPAASVLNTMSCAPVEHHLRVMARCLLRDRLPAEADILSDTDVMNGCKALLNVLSDTGTWVYARDEADRLNSVRNEKTEDNDKL